MPPEPIPISCSLSASDLEDRLAEIRKLGSSALISAEVKGVQATLRLRADEGVEGRLQAIAAAEAECCSFLTLRVVRSGGSMELSIEGPAEGQAIVEELAGAFAGRD
jgi:hypothetical protein